MNTKNFLKTLMAGVVMAGLSSSAQAQTSYTDLATFLGATGGFTFNIYNFEGIAPANGFSTNPSLLPLSVVLTNSADLNYYVYDPGAAFGAYSLNGSASLVAGKAEIMVPTVSLNLGGSYTAFGTNIGFRGGVGAINNGFTATLYSGGSQVGASAFFPAYAGDFIGFTSGISFDRIDFETQNADFAYQVYDNVRVGSGPTLTPEAPALVQVLPGLVPVALILRKRRNRRK